MAAVVASHAYTATSPPGVQIEAGIRAEKEKKKDTKMRRQQYKQQRDGPLKPRYAVYR
jgi:hypothetical protein